MSTVFCAVSCLQQLAKEKSEFASELGVFSFPQGLAPS